MINVGFFLSSHFPDEYPGGKNYMKNLFFALSSIDDKQIECILFIGKKTPRRYEQEFKTYGKIVRTSLLDRKSPYWFLYKVFYKLFRSHLFAYPLIKKHNISVMSHSDIYRKNLPFKTINWVPDIQFLHLPHLWSEDGLKFEQKRFRDRLTLSDRVIFSSYDGQKDGLAYVPDSASKYVVIRPVYQVEEDIYKTNDGGNRKRIEDKYGFKGKFFYLPNQFWTHKNHKTVFEAVNLLKQRGKEILVVCTGLMEGADSKERGFEEYLKGIKQYITKNKMEKNVKFLGLIDYDDVQYLMRNSISVINPSFFEGWSSTVEEAKSIGKSLILSNLNVHLEQDAPGAVYFDPNSAEELADVLATKWESSDGGPDFVFEREAQRNIEARTKRFGESYREVVLKLIENS